MSPSRERLPGKRSCTTYKLKLAGQSIFLTISTYPDGRFGEIWIDMHKEGATLRTVYGDFARAISISAQYGIPVAVMSHAFRGTNCLPNGPVEGFEGVTRASSVIDMVFQILDILFPPTKEITTNVPVQPKPDTGETARAEGPAPFGFHGRRV
jgi:ribonucleoside-diphosphate reductase alpha chain